MPAVTKLTPQLRAVICNALRAGNTIAVATAVAGISRECFFNWLRIGRNTKRQPYHDFTREVEQVLASCEAGMVAKIAASEDWRAIAWLLERRFRRNWAGQLTVNLARIVQELEYATDDELLALARSADQSALGAGDPEG